MDTKNFENYSFTDKDVEDMVLVELPQWKKACDDPSFDGILFHPDAFGYSFKEMILLAMALKYATNAGKMVRTGTMKKVRKVDERG